MDLRLVVLGPGAAGKSTFARTISRSTGIPAVELDKMFWSEDLRPLPRAEWIKLQQELIKADAWILDGDLGPYDEVDTRLARANAVLFDLPPRVCAWRAFRRSSQQWDFWRWLLTWRRRHRPLLIEAIKREAPDATLLVVRGEADLWSAEAALATNGRDS